MNVSTKSKNILQIYLAWLPYVIIGVCVLLRILVFMHNRALEVDEANVARNLFERDFIGLLKPLDYMQFAQPGFLWVLKALASGFGYGEQTLRLFSLLCGIGALWLMYEVLKRLVDNTVLWYPLALLATGYTYLVYTTEVKPYMPDAAIALALLLMALKTGLDTDTPKKFVFRWLTAGFLAMAFSMPSVFVLTGVGLYYLYPVYKEKSPRLKFVVAVIAGWLLMFAANYVLFLKNGLEMKDLNMYHETFFVKLLPLDQQAYAHNKFIFSALFTEAGGADLGVVFNAILFIAGAIFLIYKQRVKAILLLTPLVALYIASGLHLFTFAARVALFSMPLFLIVAAMGFAWIFNIPNTIPKVLITLLALVNLGNFQKLNYLFEPLLFEEFRDALDEVVNEKITGDHLNVNMLLQPAFMYYIDIHPDKEKWVSLKDARLLPWTDNYDPVAQGFTRDAVLYSWYPEDRFAREMASFNKYCFMKKVDVYGMHLYICTSKRAGVQ